MLHGVLRRIIETARHGNGLEHGRVAPQLVIATPAKSAALIQEPPQSGPLQLWALPSVFDCPSTLPRFAATGRRLCLPAGW
jgi:hypothetical protein